MWFLDGKNDAGKIVSNPNIGYGLRRHEYAGGKTKDFYQIGLSANTSGISVYILGLDDKMYLARTYAKKLGKASVTGYCIKFKALKDIDIATLETAVRDGVEQTGRGTAAPSKNFRPTIAAVLVHENAEQSLWVDFPIF